MNWQLSTGSWVPIQFLSRTLNWQLSAVSQLPIRKSYHKRYMKWIGNWQLAAGCQFDFYQELWIGNCQLSASCQFERATIRDIWNEWQLATGSWLPIRFLSRTLNWQLSTVSQLPIRWIYHKVYMKWIGNCQLAAGCQFNFYQELWIGNCQLSASYQFDRALIRNIWNELATVNWQLAANSISIKNFELATVSQMPFRWSYHKVYMKWIGNCQLSASCQFDRALIRNTWNELATVNWQLAANSISIKNVELATVNCQPAANSMNLS